MKADDFRECAEAEFAAFWAGHMTARDAKELDRMGLYHWVKSWTRAAYMSGASSGGRTAVEIIGAMGDE